MKLMKTKRYGGVLTRIFGPSWNEVTGSWSKVHNEELYDLYSTNIKMMKSRRMRTGHVAERREVYIKFW
jgi:hypothetical protein